jgi:hypothetical protein
MILLFVLLLKFTWWIITLPIRAVWWLIKAPGTVILWILFIALLLHLF